MATASNAPAPANQPTIFGHPVGLFVLFFAEMWERFSYYGMRALLVFYMSKAFLHYGDTRAYEVYGAYGALVYATPFVGGILADRLLGARRTVIMGGLLMAAGHLLMTVEQSTAFFVALALLIVGNGFFKPNISTIVGSLYGNDPRRDGGFTIFYMGINLGAALAPLLCGYVGETYGWHYGFGLATIGMLIGLAVFVAPRGLTQALIVVGAVATAAGMVVFGRNDAIQLAVNAPVALALLVAAGIAAMGVGRGGLPDGAGAARDPSLLSKPVHPSLPWLSASQAVYAGVLVAVPVIAIIVAKSDVAGIVLGVFGAVALGSLLREAFASPKVERERIMAVLVLMFFSMLFWAFFEQAGSSINNFTDRNVNRVVGGWSITEAQVGSRLLGVPVTQQLVGRPISASVPALGLKEMNERREKAPNLEALTIGPEHVGMSVGGTELKASMFQAANPVFILIFGLLFSALWSALGRRGLEPSTPVKFGLGLLQLGLGFGVLWWGARHADGRGMVSMTWLLLGYLLHTTGELCLSPVGLSMVTKLSPARMVSTVVGAWFLATAFSGYLAGIIARFTGVSHGGGKETTIPLPIETVGVYGHVFGQIAVAAIVAAFVVWALVPLLKRWMHEEPDADRGARNEAA